MWTKSEHNLQSCCGLPKGFPVLSCTHSTDSSPLWTFCTLFQRSLAECPFGILLLRCRFSFICFKVCCSSEEVSTRSQRAAGLPGRLSCARNIKSLPPKASRHDSMDCTSPTRSFRSSLACSSPERLLLLLGETISF